MSRVIRVAHAGLNIVVHVTDAGDARLLHFSPLPFAPKELLKDDRIAKRYRIVELQSPGLDQDDHHGMKYTGTQPGQSLTFREFRDTRDTFGRHLEIEQISPAGLVVTSHFHLVKGLPIARCWTTLKNQSAAAVPVDMVTSFALTGLTKESKDAWDQVSRVHIPHNYWVGELQWQARTLPELGLSKVAHASTKRIACDGRGTWGSDGYLPMGVFENTDKGTALFFQIEHHGSWLWEITDHQNGQLVLRVSGPTFNEGHWAKRIAPGEVFESVPVAVGAIAGNFDEAMRQLTTYRRRIRRENADNRKLPVIFNDYMNCLFGDPTTAKLVPLIDAAAKAGCEYFCIDCGWYADGRWWDGVGEWLPSAKRFPNGIKEPLDHIRARGMVPGLWLEIEVMGVNCPLARRVPKEWFFQRGGTPVIDHGRYQLDFRHPGVIAHADGVIDRLVNEYGAGYIKMDYNINAGFGTDLAADSIGDGLLQHQRAYLAWLDSIFMRYPDLVIENCGSGGLRMTYSLLSRHSIQSTSDQTDYKKYAWIAAAAPTGATPEQQAVWSYPLRDGTEEETIYNMVNAMLLRIHQSGHLAEISPQRLALVSEGIATYKKIRKDLSTSLPFWPIGLPVFPDRSTGAKGWMALGARCRKTHYLAVWRLNGAATITLPLEGKYRKAEVIYPAGRAGKVRLVKGALEVNLPQQYMARIVALTR